MLDAYAVLHLARDASEEEIRHAYQQLARAHHPDRQGGDDEAFVRVQRAWEALREPEAKRQYDTQLREKESVASQSGVHVSEVGFDEMELAHDEEGGEVWCFDCRCGDVYEVHEEELQNGVNTWQCRSCSFAIRPVGTPPRVERCDDPLAGPCT